MASDSKLRSFLLFLKFAWSNLNISSPDDITEFSGSGCLTETNLEEISDQCLLQALLTVRHFYDYLFRSRINNDETKYPKSGEESCDYIKRMCSDDSWFGRPTIFERCFATISFVLTCSECTEEAFSDIKRNTHVSWSKYFYEYKKEFYNEGGWKKLSRTADSYAKVHDLIRIVNPAQDSLDFIKLYKSVENYMHFCSIRKCILENENKSKIINGMKIEFKTCASLWIKFIVQNGNAESFVASWPRNPSEVTCLLRALRYFCDPYGFKVDHSKLSSDPGLPHKSTYAAICSPGRNQKSCTKKENDRKGELQSRYSYKNSNFDEATGQESSKSIIKKVSLPNTRVEKECEVKDTKIENFTGGETDRTDNVSYTSSRPGEMWKKVKRKSHRKKDGLQVFNKSLELGEEMKQASSSPIINSALLQNIAIEKERKDSSGKENFTGGENDRTDNVQDTSSTPGAMGKKVKRKRNRKKDGLQVFNKSLDLGKEMKRASSNLTISSVLQNTAIEEERKDSFKKNFTRSQNDGMNVPYTSLMADEMLKKSNKRKRNRKKVELRDFNKSLELDKATRQASSIINSIPLQNTEVGNEHKDSGKKNFTGGENEGTNSLPYMAGEMCRKTKRKSNRKKAGLQVLDNSLELGEATRQASSNSINDSVPLQNNAVEKESDKGNVGENVAGVENVKVKVSKTCSIN